MGFQVLEVLTNDWSELTVILDENEIHHLIDYIGKSPRGHDIAEIVAKAEDMPYIVGIMPMYDTTIVRGPRDLTIVK